MIEVKNWKYWPGNKDLKSWETSLMSFLLDYQFLEYSSPPISETATLVGHSLCKCNQVKMRSHWIRVGSIPITGVLITEGYWNPETHRRRKNAMWRWKQRLEWGSRKGTLPQTTRSWERSKELILSDSF